MSTKHQTEVTEIAEDKGDIMAVEDSTKFHAVHTGSGKTADIAGATTKEVHSAELYAALQETHIPKWSKSSRKLYLSILCAFLCAIANGYDGSLMTALVAMPHFQDVFHSGTEGKTVSVIFSMYTVGAMIGAPGAAVLADRYGRRKGMFAGAIVILLGMVIAATSKTVAQLVVSRLILGIGIAIMTVGAPAYAVEIAPPHWRGRMTGIYNCGYFGGSIPAAAVTFGTNYINSNLSWQLPLIFQGVACVAVLFLVWIIPESPRYLMTQGKEEEARRFLVTYHGNGDENSKLVALEMQEMRDGIALDGIDKVWWDYRPLFTTHSGRWRFAQVMMISVFGQFSGNGLGYFNTTIYKNLGITSVPRQLGYNLANSVVSATGAVFGASLTDKMKRRPVLVIGTFVCACLLAINAGLSTLLDKEQKAGNIKVSVSQGALAAYFLFNIVFSFTYTPLQAAVPTEALETTQRAKGLAMSGILVNAIGFINTFAGPIGLQNIGYKYVWIFVGWDCIEALAWYLFGVESQGRTLEELEWVYEQPYPVRASLRVDKVVVQSDGTVTERLEG